MVFNKNDFENLIVQLKPTGFVFKSEFGSARFTKKESNKVLTIGIGFNEYFPHSAIIKGVSATINLNEVENIIENFKNKFYPLKHYGNGTVHKTFVKAEGIDYSKFDIEIQNELTFSKVAIELKKIMIIEVTSFFHEFDTIIKVFNTSEIMPIDLMANFIEQPLPQRRMVIKKLCNDINYQEYVDWLIEYYKSENDEDWREIEKLDNFLKIIV